MNTETTVAVMESQDLELVEREEALCQEVTDIEFQAGAITIDTEDDYKEAAQFGRLLKQRTAEVKDFWKPLKEAAHKAHAEICAREKAMLQPLSNAEKILVRLSEAAELLGSDNAALDCLNGGKRAIRIWACPCQRNFT